VPLGYIRFSFEGHNVIRYGKLCVKCHKICFISSLLLEDCADFFKSPFNSVLPNL
jgi:hypothetical protein